MIPAKTIEQGIPREAFGMSESSGTWGFSPEARRGSQGASRAAPGKSGLHARGEGERLDPGDTGHLSGIGSG